MLVRVRKRNPANEADMTGRNMSITAPGNTFFSQVSAKMKEVFSPANPPCIKSSTNLSFDCDATSKVQSGVSTGRRPLREQPKNSSTSNKIYSARSKAARSDAMSIARPQKPRCQTRGEPRGVQLKQGLKLMHTKREIQLSNSGFCKSGSLYQQSYSAASRLIQQEILKQQRSKRHQNVQLQLKHILTPKENKLNLNPFLHTFVNNSKINVEQHNTESNQIKTEMEHYPEMTSNHSERKAELSHKLQTRPLQVPNRIDEQTNEANATPDHID